MWAEKASFAFNRLLLLPRSPSGLPFTEPIVTIAIAGTVHGVCQFSDHRRLLRDQSISTIGLHEASPSHYKAPPNKALSYLSARGKLVMIFAPTNVQLLIRIPFTLFFQYIYAQGGLAFLYTYACITVFLYPLWLLGFFFFFS